MKKIEMKTDDKKILTTHFKGDWEIAAALEPIAKKATIATGIK